MSEQSIPLLADWYSAAATFKYWQPPSGNRPQIDAVLTDGNTRVLRYIEINSNGLVRLNIASDQTEENLTGQDLSSQFEDNGSLIITAGSNSITVSLAGVDTLEPYEFIPPNSVEVIAFFNALSDDSNSESGTLVIDDGVGVQPDTPAAIIDTQIISTPAALSDTYGFGETIQFTVTYAGNVDVDITGGTPEFPMNFGGSPAGGPEYASYASGSGTTELVFEWTVAATDEDDNGIFFYGETDSQDRGEIRLNGGHIYNAGTTVEADLTTLNRGTKSAHKVDGSLSGSVTPDASAPTVTISGDHDVDEGGTLNLSAAYSGGTYDTIGITWEVDSGVGLVTDAGVYIAPSVTSDQSVILLWEAIAEGTGTNAVDGTSDIATGTVTFTVRNVSQVTPNASAPTVVIDTIDAGDEGTDVDLSATISGGTYDELDYVWTVEAGTLDDATSDDPTLTRPDVIAHTDYTADLTITARGTGTNAVDGTSAVVMAAQVTFTVNNVPSISVSIGPIRDEQYDIWLGSSYADPIVIAQLFYSDTEFDWVATKDYVTSLDDDPANMGIEGSIIDGIRIVESLSRFSVGSLRLILPRGIDKKKYISRRWYGQPIKLYLGDSNWKFSDFRLQAIVINGGIVEHSPYEYEFKIVDAVEWLNFEIDGPRVYGLVYNVLAELVDEQHLEYRFRENVSLTGDIEIFEIRDKGVLVYKYGGNNSWDESHITTYVVGVAKSRGTFRMPEPANGTVTVTWKMGDIPVLSSLLQPFIDDGRVEQEGTSIEDYVGNSMIDGYWISHRQTEYLGDILLKLIELSGGSFRINNEGRLELYRLDLPDEEGLDISEDDILEEGLRMVQVQQPLEKIKMRYGRNWNLQNENSIDSEVVGEDRRLLTVKYRGEHEILIINDTTGFPKIKSKTYDTISNRISVGNELVRLKKIRSEFRFVWEIMVVGVALKINLNDTINIMYPDYGFDEGVLMRVIGIDKIMDEQFVRLTCWT